MRPCAQQGVGLCVDFYVLVVVLDLRLAHNLCLLVMGLDLRQ